jgi:hypothetical protein
MPAGKAGLRCNCKCTAWSVWSASIWNKITCPSAQPRASRLHASSLESRLISQPWPRPQLAWLPQLPLALTFAPASPCAVPAQLRERPQS